MSENKNKTNGIFYFVLYCREDKEEVAKPAAASSAPEAKSETPEIDEDGFNVRPKSSETWTNDKNSFYSSSDSDSGIFFSILLC